MAQSIFDSELPESSHACLMVCGSILTLVSSITLKRSEAVNSFFVYFSEHWFKLTLRQSNQSIKQVTIYFLKPMVLSNLKLQFTTTRSSTFSGFNLALLVVTTLLATEKTRSDEAAGTEKTTLTRLVRRGHWDSWCFHHSSDDLWASPLAWLYLHRWHFAIAQTRLFPKYLQTLDGRFFGKNTVLLDGRHGCRLKR